MIFRYIQAFTSLRQTGTKIFSALHHLRHRNRKGPGHKKQEWRLRKEQTHTIDKIGKILYVNRVENRVLSVNEIN